MASTWLVRPVVIVMFALAAVGLLRPLLQDIAIHGGFEAMLTDFGRPRLLPSNLFSSSSSACRHADVAADWDFAAKIVPMIVGIMALLRRRQPGQRGLPQPGAKWTAVSREAKAEIRRKIHMDIESEPPSCRSA